MHVERQADYPFSTLATQPVLLELVRYIGFPPANMVATEYQESPGDLCQVTLTWLSETLRLDFGDGFDFSRFGRCACKGISHKIDTRRGLFIMTLTVQGRDFFPRTA